MLFAASIGCDVFGRTFFKLGAIGISRGVGIAAIMMGVVLIAS